MLFGAKRERYQARALGVLILLAMLSPVSWTHGHEAKQQDGKQPERRPLTVDELVGLLANPKIKEEEIINRIQEYKLGFGLDPGSLAKLERASVTDRILEAIPKNQWADLFFTYPPSGRRVRRLTTVYGWSKPFPGKHLWLFVHPTEVVDWTPQPEEVTIGANGEWHHTVYVGRVQEPRIVDFEIKAVWVDAAAQSVLEEYFSSKCRRDGDSYPDNCPAVRISPGAPVAQTAVLRSS
jgi:hypothetical protein